MYLQLNKLTDTRPAYYNADLKKRCLFTKNNFLKIISFWCDSSDKIFWWPFCSRKIGASPPPSWNIWQPNDYESPCILKEMHKCRPKYSGDKVAKSIFCQHFHQGDVSLITSSGGGGGLRSQFWNKDFEFFSKVSSFLLNLLLLFLTLLILPPPNLRFFFRGYKFFMPFLETVREFLPTETGLKYLIICYIPH